MILKTIVGSLFSLLVTGTCLFAGAGRLDWREAWTLLAVMAVARIVTGVMLLRRDPGLLRERFRSFIQRGQPLWDQVFYALFIPIFYGGLVLMGVDAVRAGWSEVPLVAVVLGGFGFCVASAIFSWVLAQNSFASPVVKLQAERGHRVITTGPYAYVRHPMYTAGLLMFPSQALMLGSWWGLVIAGLLTVLFVGRTAFEDRLLRRSLGGYAEYASRVRYRLIPGVW